MTTTVKSSSLKLLPVGKRQPLKKFLESSKLLFSKGNSYYEMTKGEIIQDYKKVVVMRKSDEAFITGDGVREILKIPKVSTLTKFVLDTEEIPDFSVFIQSTSHNRVLMPGTNMLYDMRGDDGMEDLGEETGGVSPGDGVGKGTGRRSTRTRGGGTASTAKKALPAPVLAGRKRRAVVSKEKEDEDEKEEEEPVPRRKIKDIKAKNVKTKGDKKLPATAVASAPDAVAPAATSPLPPGGPTEIAFSFDTTGSMYACLGEVRRRLQETITRLKRDIPGIRMAVIAHGDYCDSHTYVTKHCDFTSDVGTLCRFVDQVAVTGGGDFEECYELVLHEAYTKLSWTAGTQRSLVVIGDATPHEPNYPLNRQKLDWRKECDVLKERGIRIYAVQALNRSQSTSFYREMARRTDGFHLLMDQFASVVSFMLAICYREQGADQLQNFEDEVRTHGMNRELHRLFDSLSGRTTAFSSSSGATVGGSSGLLPIDPSRFQVLEVDVKCSIKDFVQRNSLIFKAGRGFYEFTKPETISHKKEVVLVDKATGDMYTGSEACDMIGAGGTGKVQPAALDKFRVFVQSPSYNRVLMPDTGFLYEVDADH